MNHNPLFSNPQSARRKLFSLILFIFIQLFFAGRLIPVTQSYPPLVPEGEVIENLPDLLKNISWQNPIQAIAFSPDGKTIASVSEGSASWSHDFGIHLWDMGTDREIRRFEEHSSSITSVALSLDEMFEEHTSFLTSVTISPDGRTIASASWDSTIRLWDVNTGKHIDTLIGHTGSVRSVTFSPDGRTIASGSGDSTIRLWDADTGKHIDTLQGHTNIVSAVTFSPDGKTIASGAWDKTIRLWDAKTGGPIKTLQGHKDWVNSVTFGPDGKTIASGSADNTIRLWDANTGNSIKTLQGHSSPVNSVTFSPDGKTIASGSADNTIRLWDPNTGGQIKTLQGHTKCVNSVTFSPDGKTIASGSRDSTIRLWDANTGDPIKTLQGHKSWVAPVTLSPDGKTIASGALDFTIHLWDADTGKSIKTLQGHSSLVNSITFSPDGKTIASGSGEKSIRLWDSDTGNPIKTLQGHTGSVESVTFSPDGKTIASGSGDNTIRLWDANTGNTIKTLQGHNEMVSSVTFSPDGKTIASGSLDTTIRLWDVNTGDSIKTLQEHNGVVSSVTFSPDGKTIASGSWDSTIRLWDSNTGKSIKTLQGHTSFVYSVTFSPDGKTIASGSRDSTIRLWNVYTGELIKTEKGDIASDNSISFPPDEKTRVSVTDHSTIQLHKLNGSQWTLSKILIGGSKGNWLSFDAVTNRTLRGDDGTLLVTMDSSGIIKPVPPPEPEQKGNLEITGKPNLLRTRDGEDTPFVLTLRNSGKGRIYWIKAIQDRDREQTNAAGEQKNPLTFYPPDTHLRLEPGESFELPCKVSANSGYSNPHGQSTDLYLKITALYNNRESPIPIKIPVTVQTPCLKLVDKPKVQKQEQHVLTAAFENTGKQDLPVETVFSAFIGDTSLGTFTPPEAIKADTSINITFNIPNSVEIDKDTRVTIIAKKTSFPSHAWEFKNTPITIPLPSYLWYLYALAGIGLLFTFGSVYFMRYYRHPLVLELTAEPTALRHFPPGQLVHARKLLFPRRRLEAVLEAAGINRERYDKALAFYHETLLPPAQRVQYLVELLGATAKPIITEEHIYIYELKMSPGFILNMNRCLLVYPHFLEEQSILNHLQKIEGFQNQVCFIILPYQRHRSELYLTAQKLDNMLVVPDLPVLTELLLSDTPLDVFARLVASQIKVTRISPYQTGGGVDKEAVFFGREQLLLHIMQREPANYLLVGGRQLGKSSLLKAIERRYQKDPSIQCRYLVLNGPEIASHLARVLDLPPDTPLPQLLEKLNSVPKRLFLVDEADKFIAAETQTGCVTLQHFRGLSEEGKCWFIFAGFWDLYRSVAFDYQSPIKNFGEILTIEALETDACRKLATKPMELLNISYESDELVETLLHETGQRANLIAIVCNEVLKLLDMTDRVIRREHLETALDCNAVRTALSGWETFTFDENANRLDRIMVYATIEKDAFTLSELMNILEMNECRYEPELVKQSLARLELGFILKREKQTYTFRVPLFKKMILEQNPVTLLKSELKRTRLP